MKKLEGSTIKRTMQQRRNHNSEETGNFLIEGCFGLEGCFGRMSFWSPYERIHASFITFISSKHLRDTVVAGTVDIDGFIVVIFCDKKENVDLNGLHVVRRKELSIMARILAF